MSSANVERDVIATLITNQEILNQISEKLKSKYLTVPYLRWVYKKLVRFEKKYGDLPKVSYFVREIAKDKKLSKEEKERYDRLVRRLYKRKLTKGSKAYALDEVERFAAKQEVMISIEKSLDRLEHDELEEAVGELTSTARIRTSEREYEISNWGTGWTERQNARKIWKKDPIAAGVIPFPWSGLNKLIHGIQPKEVGTIAATTNIGKSIALMICGKYAFVDGWKVLHIEIEDSKELIERRYDASILGVPSDALKTYSFTKSERRKINEKVQIIRGALGDNLIIAKCYPRKTSIVTIDRIMWTLKRQGWEPDFIVIDHADVMAPSEKQEQYRLDQSVIYWDLNTFADIKKKPILTATHIAKSYKGKQATAEALAEAYDKARILQLILTLNQLDDTSPQLALHIAKNRDGPKGATIPLLARFNMMRLVEAKFVSKAEEEDDDE